MVNAANTYMLCAWLAHQILLSVATLSVPNYYEKMKNNMPPACCLENVLMIDKL